MKTEAINVRAITLPKGLLEALERRSRSLQYTPLVDLFNVIWTTGYKYVGVFGDGANGAYEWFRFTEEYTVVKGSDVDWRGDTRPARLETSDCGYGCMSVALRDVLNIVEPPDPKELAAQQALRESLDKYIAKGPGKMPS